MRRPTWSAPASRSSHLRRERRGEPARAHHRLHQEAPPDAIVILDSKRGDIGSTAEQHAHEAFERYGADAVTVNPISAVIREPSSSTTTRASSLLCRTSNAGARDLRSQRRARAQAVPARRGIGGL